MEHSINDFGITDYPFGNNFGTQIKPYAIINLR